MLNKFVAITTKVVILTVVILIFHFCDYQKIERAALQEKRSAGVDFAQKNQEMLAFASRLLDDYIVDESILDIALLAEKLKIGGNYNSIIITTVEKPRETQGRVAERIVYSSIQEKKNGLVEDTLSGKAEAICGEINKSVAQKAGDQIKRHEELSDRIYKLVAKEGYSSDPELKMLIDQSSGLYGKIDDLVKREIAPTFITPEVDIGNLQSEYTFLTPIAYYYKVGQKEYCLGFIRAEVSATDVKAKIENINKKRTAENVDLAVTTLVLLVVMVLLILSEQFISVKRQGKKPDNSILP